MGVTVQQIADATGVSRGTVDRALNNRGRVDPEVAEKIRRAAAELGYVKKPRKTAKKRKIYRLGVVTHLSGASFMIAINRVRRPRQGRPGRRVILKEGCG